MPTLRNKVNKRKSDSFVLDNAKAQKISTGTITKRNVQVPLADQLKSLREVHEVLVKENDKNLKVIADLKIQVALLVHTRSSKTGTDESKETQTESSMGCTEESTSTVHKFNENKTKSKYSCNKCEEIFDNKWEVMAHRKQKHPSTIIKCKFLVQGICAFGNECWFRHDKTDQSTISNSPKLLTQYKCGFCENKFLTKKEFMQHRKN